MSQGLVTASYIVAAVLFILSLAGLSKQETAKHGNLFGIAGMAIALLATVFNPETSGVHWIIPPWPSVAPSACVWPSRSR